jgi:ubiquinone/menaquinone biosynthesis C-methylase UbiE
MLPLSSPMAWDLVAAPYATDVAPFFTQFAEHALRLAGVAKGAAIVDVASGPGTLALAAARAGYRVSAIDFSRDMIEQLHARAAREGIMGVSTTVGDGMSLPFADASFDAAFSLFGLMFFHDRDRGFRELQRVLVPGGRVVITSWVPIERVALLATLFGAVARAVPEFSIGQDALASPGDIRDEMTRATFREVAVTEVSYALNVPSLQELWDSMQRTNAPLAWLEKKLGPDRWQNVAVEVIGSLRDSFGSGPQRFEMIANVGVGRK